MVAGEVSDAALDARGDNEAGLRPCAGCVLHVANSRRRVLADSLLTIRTKRRAAATSVWLSQRTKSSGPDGHPARRCYRVKALAPLPPLRLPAHTPSRRLLFSRTALGVARSDRRPTRWSRGPEICRLQGPACAYADQPLYLCTAGLGARAIRPASAPLSIRFRHGPDFRYPLKACVRPRRKAEVSRRNAGRMLPAESQRLAGALGSCGRG